MTEQKSEEILSKILNGEKDWIKEIVSLENFLKFSKNIHNYNSDLGLALLLSTKNACPVIDVKGSDKQVIKNGSEYRNKLLNMEGGLLENKLIIPSIKTQYHIVRLQNCIILERGNSGFFLLNIDDNDILLNDLYLDWNTQLYGIYEMIGGNTEITIGTHLRNKIIIGIKKIEKHSGYYFIKKYDEPGKIIPSEPSQIQNIVKSTRVIKKKENIVLKDDDFPPIQTKRKK